MVYTVTLNPALDYYLNIDELSNDVQIANSSAIDFGGKGINVSVILSRLDVDTIALGFKGGFSGEKLCSLLENEKIKTDFLEISSDTRINVKITGAKPFTVNSNSTDITMNDEQKLIEKLACVQNGDYLVLAGSIPKSLGSLAYERILASLENKNIQLVVDTSGEALMSILKYNPFLIKPNNFELEEVLKCELKTKEDYIDGAKQLQSMGAKNVMVSLGKKGMLLVAENGEILEEPIIEGKVKNTNGCGDSAVAGFIAGYLKNKSYKDALHLASVCANATAFSDRLATKQQVVEVSQK